MKQLIFYLNLNSNLNQTSSVVQKFQLFVVIITLCNVSNFWLESWKEKKLWKLKPHEETWDSALENVYM